MIKAAVSEVAGYRHITTVSLLQIIVCKVSRLTHFSYRASSTVAAQTLIYMQLRWCLVLQTIILHSLILLNCGP